MAAVVAVAEAEVGRITVFQTYFSSVESGRDVCLCIHFSPCREHASNPFKDNRALGKTLLELH